MPKNLKNLGDRLPRAQYDSHAGDPGRKLTLQITENTLEPDAAL